MPRPAHRSRSRRKIFYRAPSGETRVRYEKKKTGKIKCGLCGAQLHGVPHGKRPVEVRKLNKSRKRPERMFGGVLCHKCLERVLKTRELVKTGHKDIKDVEPIIRPYIEAIL
jgi:large subunit ribosomal protein L34e